MQKSDKPKTLFPRWDVRPEDKGDDWILQYVKATWDEWRNVNTKSFIKGSERYHLNRLYARDQQPVENYQERYVIDDDPSSTYMNLNWEPMPVLSKFIRIIEDKIGKRLFGIDAQAIDPQAVIEKDKYERREKTNIELRQDLGQLGIDSSVLDTGEVDQPMDEEELAMKMEFDWKHNDAIDVEKRIDAVFQHERIEELRRKIRKSLTVDGIAAVKDWTESDGRVKLRVGDVAQMGVSPTKDPFFQDIWYVFEVVLMSASEVQERGGFSNQQMEEIVQRFKKEHGNDRVWGVPTNFNTGPYDRMKIPVVDITFKTTNRVVWEKRIDKRGNTQIGRVDMHSKRRSDREYRIDDKKYWYQAMWVMDTDYMFEAKPCENQKRKRSSMWDSIPNWTIISPELYNMETVSIVDNLRPLVDQIYHAGIKLQNVIATARPHGILIEIGAMEDVSLDGETTMDPLEIIDMFNQTGNLLYRLEGIDGESRHWKPIEELKNGLGQEAMEHFNVINTYFQYMRDMLGFNDITDGTTPDSRTLNGVAALAEQGTNNAIAFIAESERMLLERVADSVAIRVWDSVIAGHKFYEGILGTQALKDIKEDKYKGDREFSITIQDEPDALEKEDLRISTEKAIETGQITVGDKYRITNIRNMKQAQQLLSYIIAKREEKAQEAAMQTQEKNIQDQQQSVMVAEEEKRKTLSLEKQLEAQNLELEYKLKTDLERIKLESEMDREMSVQSLKNMDNDRERGSKEKINREKPKPSSSQQTAKK